MPVWRLRTDFHCSIDIKAPVSSGISEQCCAPDRWGLFIGNNKGTILICHHGGKHHFEISTSYCLSWPFLRILSPVNKLSILTAVEMWAMKKKKSLGILIILGTFACKHLPVCAIWLLAAEKLFFKNILMNPGTSLPLAWVVCLSPEQGEGWETGGDSGRCRVTSSDLPITSG